MKKLIFGMILFHFVGLNSQAQVTNIINETLPDRIGVGNHASIIKSISSLLAVSLRSNPEQNVLAHKNVSNIEYFDGYNWITMQTESWKGAFDNNNATSWHIDRDTIRFIIDLGGAWVYPSAYIVGQDWGGGELAYTIKVETADSKTPSIWNPGLDETSSNGAAGLNVFMADFSASDDRYVRITLITGANSTNFFKLYQLTAFSSRPVGLKQHTVTDWEGNIGMGTSPISSAKLNVNGTIRSKEVKVEAAPWPDYVFSTDYALPTLKETETYIQENHRLPNMPSAEEVAENGIALGEMNRLLVEKVEELTLHVIQLEKDNQELNRGNMELKEQVKQLPVANSQFSRELEELTLHVIELEKENRILKTELSESPKANSQLAKEVEEIKLHLINMEKENREQKMKRVTDHKAGAKEYRYEND